jgi:hypothetical protein
MDRPRHGRLPVFGVASAAPLATTSAGHVDDIHLGVGTEWITVGRSVLVAIDAVSG